MPSSDLQDPEWEYEYDEEETEDVYFTLDLTAHVPDAVVDDEKSRGSPPPNETNSNNRDSTSQTPDARSSSQLQILDLHGKNPLLKFNQGIYSCYWSSDYGSQIYISEPGTVENPRRPGHVLDIIGLSQARLIAVPATVRSRQDPDATEEQLAIDNHLNSDGLTEITADTIEITRSQPIVTDTPRSGEQQQAESEAESSSARGSLLTGDPISGSNTPKLLNIDRDACRDANAHDAASFLEQLSAIKQEKGETDQIPIFSVKYYHPPPEEEQAAIREAAFEEAERRGERRDPLLEAHGNMRKKKRRRFTKREMGTVRRHDEEESVPGDFRFMDSNDLVTSGKQSRQATARRVGFQDH